MEMYLISILASLLSVL